MKKKQEPIKVERTFENIAEAYASPDLYEKSLQRAIREMESFENKYNKVSELKKVTEAMREFLTKK